MKLADNTLIRYVLRLNIEKWGTLRKGDEREYFIRLDSLERIPIDKHWDIVSKELVIEEEDLD